MDNICEAVWMEDRLESGEVAILETGVKFIELGTDDSQEYFSRIFVSAKRKRWCVFKLSL